MSKQGEQNLSRVALTAKKRILSREFRSVRRVYLQSKYAAIKKAFERDD